MYIRFRWLSIAVLIVLVLNSCGAQALAFQSLDQGLQLRTFSFQTRQPGILVLTNAQDIDRLLPQLVPIPPTGLPLLDSLHALDYNRFFAILVLQGQSGGHSDITIEQIQYQADGVVVYASFVTPKPGEGQTGNGTDAYHVVAVSKNGMTGRSIRFELVDNSVFGGVVAATTHSIP
jgi:hypothetical protein